MEENVQSTVEHGIAEQSKSTCSDEKRGVEYKYAMQNTEKKRVLQGMA